MEPDVKSDVWGEVEGPRPSFTRALLTSFLIYSSSVLLVFLPLLGPILAITLVPYLSAALGTRWAHPKERVPVSLTTSITWSVLETAAFIAIVSSIPTPTGFVMDGIGTIVLVMVWASNIGFGVLGALHPWKDPFKDYSGR